MNNYNKVLGGVKNIIFDLGGVLLNIDPQLTVDAFVKLGLRNTDKLYTKLQQHRLFDRFETGDISIVEFCNDLRHLSNISVSDEQIIDAWNMMILDFPASKIDLLNKLKSHYRLFLLSNTTETHIKKFDAIVYSDTGKYLYEYFEKAYYSNEMGMRKPHVEIFQYVMKQHGMLPPETLFVDDSLANIEGAQKAGLNTLHITEKGMVENFFKFG